MSSIARDIDRDELWEKIRRGDRVVLVDALAPIAYAASHLPGAINMPPETVEERAQRQIPDRRAEIVVYCASPTCDASIEVAQRLLELGYANVRHYPGGKTNWLEAGLPLEGGRAGLQDAAGETTTP